MPFASFYQSSVDTIRHWGRGIVEKGLGTMFALGAIELAVVHRILGTQFGIASSADGRAVGRVLRTSSLEAW